MRVTPIYLTWLDYLGGYEYFLFTAEKEYQIDILETGTTRENVFPNWGKSWGETADTIDKKTFTTAKNKIAVVSQYLTENQRDALKYIKISPVVQIVLSRTDRRTVIVDNESFKVYNESEKVFIAKFNISFTDEIAAQRQ